MRNKKQDELWPSTPAMPGAKKYSVRSKFRSLFRLVEYFASIGIPQGVATGSSTGEYNLKTSMHQGTWHTIGRKSLFKIGLNT